jgi:class 3 adenylate cyclase
LERRLAAILAADVAGYTALMGADEAGTLRRLTDLRQEFLEPLIDEHHGRVVKLMGDGLLAEFASVVDAVTCALAWQDGVAEREAAAEEDKRLRFRIAINLGRAWRVSLSLVASASPATPTARCAVRSKLNSRIWETVLSRTLPSLFGSIASRPWFWT